MYCAKSFCVEIPTFINPHLFWIFDRENRGERTSLEEKLKAELKSPKQVKALEGEFVAVFENHVWKRAEVKRVFDEDYDCWLMDYGVLRKMSKVYKLPTDFTMAPAMARSACLNDVVELSQAFNVLSEKIEYQKAAAFSVGVSNLVRSYIVNSEAIVFHTECVLNNVFCGQLELTRNGAQYNLIKTLLDKKRVILDKQAFSETFKINYGEISTISRECVSNRLPRQVMDDVANVDKGVGRGYNRNNKPVDRKIGRGSNKSNNVLPETPGSSRSPLQLSVQKWVDENVQCCVDVQEQVLSGSSFNEIEATSDALDNKGANRKKSESNSSFSSLEDQTKDLAKSNADPKLKQSVCGDGLFEDAREDAMAATVLQRLSSETSSKSSHRSGHNVKVKNPQSVVKHQVSGGLSQLTDSIDSIHLEDTAISNVRSINRGKRDTLSVTSSNFCDKYLKTSTPNMFQGQARLSDGDKHISSVKSTLGSPFVSPTTESPASSASSSRKLTLSSKLPGFNLYPSGVSIAAMKHHKTSPAPSSKASSEPIGSIWQAPTNPSRGSISSSRSGNSRTELASKPTLPERNDVAVSTDNDSDSDQNVPPRHVGKFMSIGCKCDNCKMWNKNDIAGECNEYKEHKNCAKRVIVKPSPLFKTESTKEVVKIDTRKFKGGALTKIEKDINPSLLVHGTHVPAPSNRVTDVPFNASVHLALTKLKFSSTKAIQSYVWPALMRQMNVCMVHGPRTGKTMAYLPAICSFVVDKSERYPHLPGDKGPIAVVLCEGVNKTEETYHLFCNFRAYMGKKFSVCWAAPPLDVNCWKNIKTGCDILVTTPLALTTILKCQVITLKRVCHFVVEEADKILDKFREEFGGVMAVLQSMLEHRSCHYGVFVVACSEHWTVPLENFLTKLNTAPLICIGSYLEAALYGRADIQMHFIQSKAKLSTLTDILMEKSHVVKTVVVCNEEEEVETLVDYLRVKGVSVTIVSGSMMREELTEAELMWENTVSGKHTALICTDTLLHGQLSVTNAALLVHYSLPSDSWTAFSRRFKCLVDSYSSPLFAQKSESCKVHIFVDQTCVMQFPRLYDFLELMGAKLSPKFLDSCKQIKDNEELEKLENKVKLCDTLKLFGTCKKARCKRRHVVSDKADIAGGLPQCGTIKFRLMSINDVSIYTVRLTEHTDTKGKIQVLPDSSEIIGPKLTQLLKENRMYAKNPQLGDLFAWFDAENGSYHRCEIVKVISENRITREADEINVKLIDVGKVKKTTSALLFELSDFYKNLPPQGVEIYLANILPPDNDSAWSYNMKQRVEKMVDSAGNKKDGAYFSGRIVLQIENTLWLDNVRLLEDLTFSDVTVTRLVLKNVLLDNHLASHDTDQLARLYDLCKTAGINLPSYECASTAKLVPRKVEQVKPQWSFFDEDGLNAVYFCSGASPYEFHVRLEKFDGLFQKLQRELQEVVRKPHYPKVEEVTVGNCYLAKDPGSDDYCRAIVTTIEDDMVGCYFVDFGDSTCVLRNELKHLPDNYIKTLPFQIIECKLFGISPPMDSWPDEATDVLYQYCFEPKTENCDTQSDIYRTLYVSTLSLLKESAVGCRKYSVLLIDYYSRKPVLVNKILIDCGLAVPVEDVSLENISLPECRECNDESEDDILDLDNKREYTTDKIENMKQEINGNCVDDDTPKLGSPADTFDVVINDMKEFFMDFIVGTNKTSPSNVNCSSKTHPRPSENLYPIKTLPPATHHTPDLLWYQTEKHVKMNINMPNVTEYTLQVVRRRVLNFSTTQNGKVYKLNFQLYDLVEKSFQHSTGGLTIRVTLEKSNSKEWPRLTFGQQKLRHIRYDLSKCSLPEEKKRLFLQIDGAEQDEDCQGDDKIIEIGSDVDYSDSDVESEPSD